MTKSTEEALKESSVWKQLPLDTMHLSSVVSIGAGSADGGRGWVGQGGGTWECGQEKGRTPCGPGE